MGKWQEVSHQMQCRHLAAEIIIYTLLSASRVEEEDPGGPPVKALVAVMREIIVRTLMVREIQVVLQCEIVYDKCRKQKKQCLKVEAG